MLLKPAAQPCRSRAATPSQAREDPADFDRAAAPATPSFGAISTDSKMLVDRHVPEEPAPVGDETHPARGPDLRSEILHSFAIEKDLAALPREKSLKSLEQRGFPRAVGAEDRQDLSGVDGEAHSGEDGHPGIAARKLARDDASRQEAA